MGIKSIIYNLSNFLSNIPNRICFIFNGVTFPKNGKIRGKVHLVNRGTIKIGKSCTINGRNKYVPIGCGDGCNIIAEKNANICIGENLGMTNATVYSRLSVTIGDRVLIGGGAKIYDTDFHSLEHQYRGTSEDKKHTKSKPVVIGDDVFIGATSIILKGATIGNRSIIGAGSVVSGHIPDDEIWAGNPARCIRKNHT